MRPAANSVVLLEDGCLHDGCDLTPQQVLTKHSGGVYTTALVTPDGHVVEWPLHRERLLRGIEILNTQPSRPFQPLLSALESQGSSLAEFFDQRVQPPVRSALAAFHSRPDPPSPQHAMLVVCISPPPSTATAGEAAADTAAAAADAAADADSADAVANASRSGSPACNAATVAPAPTRSGGSTAERGLAGSAGDGTTGRPACGSISGGGGGGGGSSRGPPANIVVYCRAVQPPPYGPEHAVQAAVMGRPRSLPGAKACSWVRQRRCYEERKPPEAAEVLLADASGRILEGLTTNFCVITTPTATATPPTAAATRPRCGAATMSGSEPTPRELTDAAAAAAAARQGAGVEAAASAAVASPVAAAGAGAAVLRVCGPAADAALPGVVQARVVEAARRLGLAVVLEPPSAAERDTWREAFLTNCIRRLQPLSRVFCPPGNAWGADPWDCWLPHPAGPLTTALLREVERMEDRTHWREL